MRDAEVERAQQHRAPVLERVDAAEVVPQAERDRGQLEAALADAVVTHAFVTTVGGSVGHRARSMRHYAAL